MGSAGQAVVQRALRVHVLGGFAVEGLEEQALGTRKARVLLKRLALARGRPVAAEELAVVVWGDGQPRRPNDQISVLVSRLRAVLGAERLKRTDAGYCLVADWFDVEELEARTTEVEERLRAGELGSALAAGHAALAIARGPLLPEEDASWVDEARHAIDRLVARARLLAAEAAMAVGEFGAARVAAHAVLDHDPYDEAALRLVMRADALAGKPGAALAAYAEVRHRLAEDLGANPAPETEELHSAVLRGEVAAPAQTRAVARAVVGRDVEHEVLDDLLHRVASGAGVAVVIDAEAGMGKSALLASWTTQAGRCALVLAGRCDELGGGLPLQPLIDPLAAHLGTLGRAAATELLGAEALMLDPLLGRAVADRGATVTVVADAQAGRTTLFAALAAVLGRAAGKGPLVLVVDDLHLAPAGTDEFLAFALRRIPRLMVLAARRPEPGPDLHGATRVALGPLTLADTVAMVGPRRGPALHGRSGGHPLFLKELAAAPDGELPGSIVAAVTAQVARMGDAAITLAAAASCGGEVEVELVSAITGRSVAVVLDDVEHAARIGLLRPQGSTLAFTHDLVREAIETATSPSRRTSYHRAAVVHLAARPDTDPLALARHARLGGDAQLAAQALTAASARSAERFETSRAEELLDQALQLCDAAPARLARGRLRLARLDLQGARLDAARAIELGAGVQGFELAGWIAYYERDYDAALRYADEGIERSVDEELRASCLALSGRIRHTRGDLPEAARRLEQGVATAPPGIRGVVQVWHAQLLAHRGEPDAAVDTARRGLLDPHLAHPFAAGHGRFTVTYASAVAGHWGPAFDALEDLDDLVARQDDRRFQPVAANLRGWLLRGAGQLDAARELHRAAAEMAPGPTFLEAHYAAVLDLAEDDLAGEDLEAAAATIDACADMFNWTGSMFWRHHNRYRLLAARIASAGGDHSTAADDAREVAAASAARGDRRYEYRALVVAVTADARAGRPPDLSTIGTLVDRFVTLSGPDGWRDLGHLALALRSEDVWRQADELAASLVAGTARRSGVDGEEVARAVRHQVDSFKP